MPVRVHPRRSPTPPRNRVQWPQDPVRCAGAHRRHLRLRAIQGPHPVRGDPEGTEVLHATPAGRQGRESIYSLDGVPRVVFHHPEVEAADRSTPLLWTEGEKDVLAAERHGFLATTTSQGSGSLKTYQPEYLRSVAKDRPIIIVADPDPQGEKYANGVAIVAPVAASIKIVRLDGLDLFDWFASGHTADDLRAIIAATPLLDDPTPSDPDPWDDPVPFDDPRRTLPDALTPGPRLDARRDRRALALAPTPEGGSGPPGPRRHRNHDRPQGDGHGPPGLPRTGERLRCGGTWSRQPEDCCLRGSDATDLRRRGRISRRVGERAGPDRIPPTRPEEGTRPGRGDRREGVRSGAHWAGDGCRAARGRVRRPHSSANPSTDRRGHHRGTAQEHPRRAGRQDRGLCSSRERSSLR